MFDRSKRFIAVGLIIYIFGISIASAETVADPQQWIGRFSQALQDGDAARLKQAITDLPTRSGNGEGLAPTASLIANFTLGKAFQYASALQAVRLGDGLSRFVLMAKYNDNKPLFILFDFMRSADGWLLLEVAGNTNLNTLLTWPWDFK